MACFTSNTIVLTSNGYKSIQSLNTSDLVFTHKSNWKPIVNSHETVSTGAIITIKSAGSTTPIQSTAEQPFLTKCMNSTGFGPCDFILSEKTSWTPANSLKAGKHMLCVPIEQSSQLVTINIEIDGEKRSPSEIDWFMVGFYVGKGKHVLEVNFIPPGWNILREFTSCPDSETAICNCIPEWVQRLPIEKISSFIQGFEKSAARHYGFTVSNELVALCMQRLYAKLKLFVAIDMTTECVTLIPGTDADLVKFDEHYMYIPIESVSDEQKQAKVYNIKVVDDYSYVVENMAACNKN